MSRALLGFEIVRPFVVLLACCTLLTAGVATATGDTGTAVADGSTIERPADLVDDATDELDSGGDETAEDAGETDANETDGDADDGASTLDPTDGSSGELLIDAPDGRDGGLDPLTDSEGTQEPAVPSGSVTDRIDGSAARVDQTDDTGVRSRFGSTLSVRFVVGSNATLLVGTGTESTLRVDLADPTSPRLQLDASNSADAPEERTGRDESAAPDDTDDERGVAADHAETRSSITAGLVGVLGVSAIAGGASAVGGGSGAAAGSPAVLGRLLHILGQFGSLTSLLAKKLPLSLLRYSRYDDSDPLDHETRRSIYETIEAEPGRYLSAIEADSDVSLSTVRHHLDVLEAESLIVAEKRNGKRRFYPVASERRDLAAAMDEPARARLIEALVSNGPMTNGELADRLDRDPSTISHHVAALADDELLTRTREGRTIVNALAPGVEAAYRERVGHEHSVPSVDGVRPVGVEGAD
ncbi:helix-turn-helix domain-containing protein [Halovivax limisalsi]|uniref:helix-turn-helix domain-containing protein n=1 Tax=Halovivax limisalsi TaxID=1453760 RepID=UPI001FFC5F44|nr:helix-turn-helix domain-containing protein [Halovivax limisalsi]